MLCFAGLALTDIDSIPKVLLAAGVVRLAVIGSHARAGTDDLADQRNGHRIGWHLASERNDGLAEFRSALLQVETPAPRIILRRGHCGAMIASSFEFRLRHSFVIRP